MGVLSIILLVLFVVVSLLLIFLVAVQDEQSEGLGGIFGGGSNTAFGSHTSSVVTKATGGALAVLFLVLALLVAFVNKSPSQDALLDSVTTEQVQQTTDWWTSGEGAAAAETATEATRTVAVPITIDYRPQTCGRLLFQGSVYESLRIICTCIERE